MKNFMKKVKYVIAATFFMLFGCSPDKGPQQIEEKMIQKKLQWIILPGNLDDVQKMGFVCKDMSDKTGVDCSLNSISFYGIDVGAKVHLFNKYMMNYSSISILAEKPSLLEKQCKKENDVELVYIDGQKENDDKECIVDRREALVSALKNNGWKEKNGRGGNIYQNLEYPGVEIERPWVADAELFVIRVSDNF